MTPKTKQAHMIQAFKDYKSLNTFEAQRLGDTCLNTTVSILAKAGYKFRDEWEEVPNRFGRKSRCKRYWLIEEPKKKCSPIKVSTLNNQL